MSIKKLKSLRFKKPLRICYARTGHRLWEGFKKDLPENLKEFYISELIINKKYVYVEVVEDLVWFE